MKVDDLLLFSTDYPHWSYDDPAWAVNRMPRTSREKIMHRNAQDLLGLPETVPALKSADV
jgi:predicted TIM-barrel fold metal-dependent hydrolase